MRILILWYSVFDKLIWCTIGPKSFLFGTVNYDYIVTNSINSFLIDSKCIPNGTHTNHCWANLAHASKLIKNSDVLVHVSTACTCSRDLLKTTRMMFHIYKAFWRIYMYMYITCTAKAPWCLISLSLRNNPWNLYQ